MNAPLHNSAIPKPIMFGQDESISSIVKRMGENLNPDIVGRIFWYYDKLEISPERKLEIRTLNAERRKNGEPEQIDPTIEVLKRQEATSCVLTHNALMSAFFGKWHRDSKQFHRYDTHPQDAIGEMKRKILEKENATSIFQRLHNATLGVGTAAPLGLDHNNWTAYSIKINAKKFGEKKTSHATHVFIILQFQSQETILYKILQSFVGQYPFNQYNFNYRSPQIFLLLDQLLDFVLATSWNGKHHYLFNGFFRSKATLEIGNPIGFNRSLEMKSGDFNRESLEQHATEFREQYPDNYLFKVTS